MADGTSGNDNYPGTNGADLYNGLAGNDAISGNNGNDTLNGGDGNDTIYGGADNDSIDGGADNDSLYGQSGNDTLIGGGGNDYFNDYEGANSMSGGEGDDYFEYVGYGTGVDTLTGGTGRDIYRLYYPFTASYSADIITDFIPGQSGDIVRLDALGFSNFPTGSNPFVTGHLRLVQAGTSVELQGDQDGGANSFKTLIVFQNATVGAFTAANFDPGYSPSGVGEVLIGGDGANNITGTVNDDTISAGAGSDTVNGGYGNDSIDGGSGADRLSGDYGNDTILGGTGADTIYGGEGNDSLVGGDGRDQLSGDGGNDTLIGGDGDDYFSDYNGANSMSGGAGADYFEYVSYGNGADTMTGGAGSDVYRLYYPLDPSYIADTVTDFQTGTGGDVIRLDAMGFSGLAGGANPFTTGHLRLVQVGANVELQADQNGGGDSWKTVLLLQGTNVANFTATNFDPPYSPTGTGIVVTGSEGANGIQGSPDGDTISGAGGDDTINANAGNDSVDAGAGNDQVDGGQGNDTILGGSGADRLSGGDGNDSIDGGIGNDTLYGDGGNDTLIGGDGDDRFNYDGGDDSFVGGEGNDYFGDYEGSNTFSGGAGEDYFDYVSYGSGADTFSGGTGADTYRLYYPIGGGSVADTVTDFQTGSGGDIIQIDTVVAQFTGYTAGNNPFTTGYLRLMQSGANVLLQADRDGGGDGYVTVLTLQNTTVANFTSANFAPAYSPTGAGLLIAGSEGANGITGTVDGDTINAGGGNDTVDGNAGADSIDGGAGDDSLRGNLGNDTMLGGTGNDALYGDQGNDSLDGGIGDDRLEGGVGNDTLIGGDGNDAFYDYDGANSMSGGAGEDYFEYVSYGDGADTLTGGAGSDTFRLYYPFSAGYVADTVTDFQTGAGGDIIRLDALGLGGLPTGANPFTSGYLRLVQSGTSVLLQGDQNGGGDGYVTILTLQNTTVANFTAANFSPAYSPTGSGLTITGGIGDNGITGSLDGDTIAGLGGNDTINASYGNDSADGGTGNDTIYGDYGNDTLLGGAGNDQLYGGEGNDSLDGGIGDDRLEGNGGNDTLIGGDGNDAFYDNEGANVMSGGAGEDYFEYVSYGSGVDTLTGGAGRDTFRLYYPFSGGYVADVVTDFQTGTGGDIIRLDALGLSGLPAGANPFTSGYLRLVQQGANVVLQGDQNGGGDNYVTILTLQNTTVANFTAANFGPGYSPSGTGVTITGSEGGNNITGSLDGDTISGLGGNDTLYGDSGNDSIDGGTGYDRIYGGYGDDTLIGGTGNDTLYGESGNDSLDGGAGDDYFDNEDGNDTFVGGEGNDRFGDYTGNNSMSGGTGEDYFEYVSYGGGTDTLTGGAGSDTYNIYYPLQSGYVADIVTDFQGGAGGDVIRVNQLIAQFTGYTAGTNPFTGGFLRLFQSGADTLLQADRDGGGNSWTTVLVLRNVIASTILPENFFPNPDSDGTGINQSGGAGADPIAGTVDNDTLYGGAGNDTLTGLGGDDQLYGQGDNDSLSGGLGNDYLDGGDGNDSLDGGAGNDNLQGGAGADTLIGGTGYDNLSGGADNDSLEGGDGNDTFYGNAGNDTMIGGDGDDYFGDNEGANVASGGAGNDYFEYVGYGTGVDTLTGGTGNDVFRVYYPFTASYVADIVTDFQTGIGGDVIRLDALNFSGLPADTNPFTAGFLRLVQIGTNVELQGDPDGGANSWKTILVLQNTTVANFTGANFDPGYSPNGVGATINGSITNDSLGGTPDADTINGLDGNDTLSGDAGNDSIDGGAGDDTLYGNAGNDTLIGGAGTDRLYGEAGNDSLVGGDGNDSFDGGAGDDTLVGGDGGDYFADYTGANSMSGDVGEDYFEYVGYGSGVDKLTGGAGADYFRVYYPFSASYVADIVTDFQAGTGGDVIALDALGLSGLPDGANPFTSGFLRLVQVGTSVELQGDQNGGADSWKTVLILQNTSVAAITGANFNPGYSPNGAGETLTGTVLAETLVGTPNNDTILGLDGNDTIGGREGADSIDGGAGDDSLYGDSGADTILGGTGNDRLYGQDGNDSLSGGDGNDSLDGGNGNDTLTGGDGDDYFADYNGTNSMSGGAGADFFEYVGYGGSVDTLTGGSGSDVFHLYYPFSASYVADVVTDFQTGAGGDIIRLDALGFSGLADGVNPFTNGFLRLVQVGANVELQGDQNGGADSWKTILVLQGTTVAAFAASNFDPPFGPTGQGQTITGTTLPDSLIGTPDGDTITGFDGNDTIDANAGADSVDAGAGNDTVYGDQGNDTIDGGDGSDSLYGGADNDVVGGSAGNDRLYGEAGNDSLSGGEGQDSLYGGQGNDTLTGDAGDDYFSDYEGANSMSGGAGNDYFEYVSYGAGADTLGGGAGTDTYNVYYPFSSGYVADIVTDFQTGLGGDILQIDSINFSGLGSGVNPFTAGFLRLVQSGTDTLLQGDQNGGGDGYVTILTLRNTTATAFTAANFAPGYSPTGVGEVITGTSLVDNLVGTPDGDTITGLEGNDTISAYAGADSIDAGAGNDSVYGGQGNDTIQGGDGNDRIYGEQGNDSLLGGEGQDSFTVEDGNDTFRGGAGDDYLGDYQGSNVLDGGDGEDYFEYVSYGANVDTLTGGSGADYFSLYAPFSGGAVADIITDFQPGADGDVININGLGFSGLASGANPFLTGHLRLIQQGTDTLLQGDQNGGGDSWRTLLILQNVSASALSGVNFDPAFDPTGLGITFIGTPQGDSFAGSVNGDTAEGRAGNDTLDGNAGADTMLGEAGDDILYGDEGADSLDGGADNDTIYGGSESDTIIGGTGNDYLSGDAGNDNISAGTGNDTIYGGAGNDTILAGDGDDIIYDYEGANSIAAGIGADSFQYVSYGNGVDTLSGGTGSDTFNLYAPFGVGYVADIVTDFATGAGGDVIRLSDIGFTGLASGANPFSSGHLRLVQNGANVELQGDQNGGGDNWRTILVLENTTRAAFTTANFSPAYDPVGSSPPDAVNDAVTAPENGTTTILAATLLGNDTDPNGDALSITGVSATSSLGAGVSINAAGNIVYDPGTRFDYLRVGQTVIDSFTYTISDGNGGTDSATVSVTVNGANDAPTAANDAVTATEDGATTISGATLLANDTDPDSGDIKTIASVAATSAQGASVTLNAGGNVVYDPGTRFNSLRAGQTATDSFTYTMRDASGATSSATVTVTINGANDAPTAVADAVSASEGGTTTFLASTLLANDTDPDTGDSKAIASVSATSSRGASVSLNAAGNVVYNPGTLFAGLADGATTTDTFTYTMRDAAGATSSTTVTVTITGGNDAPTAVADAVSVPEDGASTILAATLLANDTDPDSGDTKTLVSVSATSTQGASVALNAAGNVVYDPGSRFNALRAGQTATDTFTYTMRDAAGATSATTVTVTINGANDAPSASGDAVAATEDGTTTILATTLLANDSDPDAGDTKALVSVSATSAAGASVSLNAAGNVVYNPGARFNGLGVGQTATDSFTYTMRDAAGATSSATVTVTINGANDAPTAVANAVTVAEDATSANLVPTLLANDTDPDAGDTLTILSVDTTGTRGTVIFNQAAQTLTYSADDDAFDPLNPGETATTTFTYTVRDAAGATSTATVTVTITGVDNDAVPNRSPDAVNDAVTLAEDRASTILASAILANDTDPDGDALTIQSVSGASAQGATVSLNAAGNMVYDPGTRFNSLRAGQTATDSFTYTVSDGKGGTDTATVAVTITGANDAPTAVADAVSVPEDGASTILASTLLANDTDPDSGDTKSLVSVSATSSQGASVSLNAAGNVVYNPGTIFNGLRAGQTGTDTFTYTMRDASGATSSTTVIVTVNGANDAPTSIADAVSVPEDGASTILASTILANDSDPDSGDTKSLVSVSATSTQGASVALNAAGNVVYDPGTRFNSLRAGQTATDTFTYTMRDAAGATSSATVTVTINGANDAPTAVANAVTVAEDATSANLVPTLLANDTDPDAGDTLTILSVDTTGTRGTVIFNQAAQTLTYSADDDAFDPLNPGETATTTFTYTVRDAAGATSTAMVTVTITGVDNDAVPNRTPDAVNDAVTLAEDGASTILASAILANDTDPDGDTLTIQSVSGASAQGATVSLNATGNMVYDPGTRFNGLRAGQTATDSFTYTVSDGKGGTDTATVAVTITGANDAPTAVADAVSVPEDGASTILASALLANDSDPDSGDTKALVSVSATSSQGASVALNAAGNVVYDPGSRFNSLGVGQTATDSFTYTMRDAAGVTSATTVTVTVIGANDAPVATADAVTVPEDGSSTILATTLLANDSDVDNGDTKALASVSATSAQGAAVSLNAAGNVVYNPGSRFNALGVGQTATDSFTYTMRDAAGATSSATVTVTIDGANDAPDARNDSGFSTAYQTALTIAKTTLLANDVDPDSGDTLVITSVQGASHGTVTLSGSNVVFTPTAGYSGAASFTYSVSDGHGGTDTATVSLTVGAAPGQSGTGQNIRGTAANDVLRGTRFDDILIGLGGDDQMYGGGGADQFRFYGNQIDGPSDRDRIYDLDFAQGDKLVFGSFASGTFIDGPGDNAFSGGTASIISSWAGVVHATNASTLVTAARQSAGNDNLVLYIANGAGQVQEIVITSGYSQYVLAGGTEGVL